jgi:RES domain-containing protein
MTPLPAPLGTGELVAWRLDKSIHAATWNTGEGAFRAGGRWNSRGVRAVYCSVDPATAILEVAVHVGFPTLDTVPYALTSLSVVDPERVHVLEPAAVPDPAWLRPGNPRRRSRLSETDCWRHII